MISIVYDQKRYHEVLARVIKPQDLVIEIGPHLGESTRVISPICARVIAVDKAIQAEEAFNSMKEVTFVKGDVRFFDTIDEVLKLTKSCNVLAMDMGGGRFPDTVFKVWAVWSGVFKPRDSIIRNRGLGEFLRRARIEDPIIRKDFIDSGWLSQSGRKRPKQLKEGLDELQHWMN
jgi:hypothetical protein